MSFARNTSILRGGFGFRDPHPMLCKPADAPIRRAFQIRPDASREQLAAMFKLLVEAQVDAAPNAAAAVGRMRRAIELLTGAVTPASVPAFGELPARELKQLTESLGLGDSALDHLPRADASLPDNELVRIVRQMVADGTMSDLMLADAIRGLVQGKGAPLGKYLDSEGRKVGEDGKLIESVSSSPLAVRDVLRRR